MFIKTKLEKARNIADNAISIFTATVNELQKSNDLCHAVVAEKHELIKTHEAHIAVAKASIYENNRIMSKLKEFCL